ncbi:hypothetical protein H7K45_20915 [Mycobacterium yunnanensis]|uniref:Uncharacterized protein n=1 Tax=Mycobacterium yunnanensis TaxID=368477 RepID=A0A9X2Z432_9MYCO|nr:hypothetical protein [Mycobacterium yunnanensis]MCV7423018.1 hypothetical protein [Mycobacterium yunnanensis]
MDTCEPPKTPLRKRICTTVEIVAIGTSPVVASWLANHVGLVAVGGFFVLAGVLSYVVSLAS